MARSDLTPAFVAAMEQDSRAPRQLAVFKFPLSGNVYISDQALTVGGIDYQPWVMAWGDLVDIAGGDPTDDTASEIRQMSLTIWNGGENPFSDRFTFDEQPESVVVELYQTFDGLADSDKALIDSFIIQDPFRFDEVSALLTLDLVSLTIQSGVIGDIITSAAYPLAPQVSIGEGIDLIIGSPGEINCHSITDVPALHLEGTILENSLLIDVKETISDFAYPPIGVVEIEEEKVVYESFSGSQFVVSQRGYDGTTAAEHLDNSELVLFTSTQEFIVGRGPIQSADNVKVGGNLAPLGIFSTSLAGAVAKIIFNQKPYAVGFDNASTFLAMFFDNVNPANTAFQAYTVFDPEDNGAALLEQPSRTLLSIQQVTPTIDRGNIVKVFLAVEHWEDGAFLNDYAEVSVDGIGVVGRLSRPNPASATEIVGEVDIDHGHSHSVSGEHQHDFTDPSVLANNPLHGHGVSGSSTTQTRFPDGSIPINFNITQLLWCPQGFGSLSHTFNFSGMPVNWVNGIIEIYIDGSYYSPPAFLRVGSRYYELASFGTTTVGVGAFADSGQVGSNLAVRLYVCSTSNLANMTVNVLKLTITENTTIENSFAGVSIVTTTPGYNDGNTDKQNDDVNDLATGNADLIDTGTQASTATNVNLFDITADVAFDWSWFDNRTITVEYKGNNDSRKFYIRHVFFDVEYRKRQVVFSDKVTCEPTGLIDDGTITGSAGALIKRPDHVRDYVLTNLSGAQDIVIDSVSFAAAGAQYAGLDYQFNGVVSASMTIYDFEKAAAFQCRSRFFWNAGTAKIELKQTQDNQVSVKDLDATDLRLRSMSALKQRSSDIINRIDLLYDKDLLTDTFDSVTSSSDDTLPIVMEDREKWNFDLVGSDAMAADLLDYYINTRSTASTFYSFQTYLKNLDLEKGDIIRLTSNFGKLKKAIMEIKSIDRAFGSGQTNKINLLSITAENLKYIFIKLALTDSVSVVDLISATLELDLNFNDLVALVDELLITQTRFISDSVSVSDLLLSVTNYTIQIPETVNIADIDSHTLFMFFDDNIFVTDLVVIESSIGFGVGGFGFGAYGGRILGPETLDKDLQYMVDVLAASLSTVLTDSQSMDDSIIVTRFTGFATEAFGSAKFGGVYAS